MLLSDLAIADSERSWGERVRLSTARTVAALHLCTTLFIVVGWALPWRPALWAVVVVTAVAQTSWLLCNDRCPLTILEERLRGPQAPAPARLPGEGDEPGNFVVDGLSRLLGRPVPYHWTNRAIYAVTWFAFTAATARLVWS